MIKHSTLPFAKCVSNWPPGSTKSAISYSLIDTLRN
jgi:hypothetical protein